MRAPVELQKSYRLLNHGPTVLVTSAHGTQKNVMAAAWSMPLDFTPAKIAIVIEATSLTRKLVEASGFVGINVPVRAQAELVLQVGSQSGRDLDKFSKHGLNYFLGPQSQVPLIEGCVAWLECKVLSEPSLQTQYDLFICEVVGAWADDQAFQNGRWVSDRPEFATLHYIAGGSFFLRGEMLNIAPPSQ